MFSIRLVLDVKIYSGLEALDLRRRFGLADSSDLRIKGELRCGVSEGFARQYFRPFDKCRTATIDVEWLARGELVDTQDDYATFGSLSDERIRELFVRAEVEELRGRVAKLTERLESATESLADLCDRCD